MSDLAPHERRWPATVTVAGVLGLQLALPGAVTAGPVWLLPVLEVALLAPVAMVNPVRLSRDTRWLRWTALTLTGLLAVANAWHLALLVDVVVSGTSIAPRALVQAALLIWITNVAAVALALWETDRGGPFARDPRHDRRPGRPDLLFVQMGGVPGWDSDSWRPSFADYLFVGFTTATAFSPTDTMPLSARAKAMMAGAASVSLVTLAIVAARAVNVL
ncbi:hypothetical protein [Pengzhenrongella sicca]|uniref:DUF1345 domain-containing protein n=1 Tax=Pengzhenrongella sicca TaxID=2819238 RepID=A0A8A4Z7K3_9MICO|nr:hypothetical protein [Pengzhenrongella sicca]QTE27784.1 hypothetical protein J4E96_10090 [Pengzhenrongella sicca]